MAHLPGDNSFIHQVDILSSVALVSQDQAIYIICLWGIVPSGKNEAPLEKTSDRLRADFRDKLVDFTF